MTEAELLQENVMRDATDCRVAFEQRRIRLAGDPNHDGDIVWGDDSSRWANDGECDDMRFDGEAMTATLSESDVKHDATDCQTAYRAGLIFLRD